MEEAEMPRATKRRGAHSTHLGTTAMSQVDLKSEAQYDSTLKQAIERAGEALE
jgi:hypothetical protein